jgi:nucleoid DNA-binding protein
MTKTETITKEKIAELLKERLGFSALLSEEITANIFREMLDITLGGEKLVLANFGKFQVYHKKKRPGVNLQTGAAMEISPRRVLRFNASAAFKEKVNSHEFD